MRVNGGSNYEYPVQRWVPKHIVYKGDNRCYQFYYMWSKNIMQEKFIAVAYTLRTYLVSEEVKTIKF